VLPTEAQPPLHNFHSRVALAQFLFIFIPFFTQPVHDRAWADLVLDLGWKGSVDNARIDIVTWRSHLVESSKDDFILVWVSVPGTFLPASLLPRNTKLRNSLVNGPYRGALLVFLLDNLFDVFVLHRFLSRPWIPQGITHSTIGFVHLRSHLERVKQQPAQKGVLRSTQSLEPTLLRIAAFFQTGLIIILVDADPLGGTVNREGKQGMGNGDGEGRGPDHDKPTKTKEAKKDPKANPQDVRNQTQEQNQATKSKPPKKAPAPSQASSTTPHFYAFLGARPH